MKSVPDLETLEEMLSRPSAGVIATLASLPGDVVVLGVGGKMGPSLARMIRRATETAGQNRRVYGVARFSDPALATALRAAGIEPIACDLREESALAQLPPASLVVHMTAMKFGTTGQEPRMWEMHTWVPALLARHYPESRWLAFSTGNVYALGPVNSAGPTEADAPAPVGEYGMSCLGRERLLECASRDRGTPMTIIRLNYACDLLYGVLVDLARHVWNEQSIDLTMGHFNIIWQGDANAWALQALAQASSPPFVLNVTGPETLSVREVCEQFSQLMNKPVRFSGHPSATALLSNAQKAASLFGPPTVPADVLIPWVARWLMDGHPLLQKPTRFEVRHGRF